jgi:hypothetical protein
MSKKIASLFAEISADTTKLDKSLKGTKSELKTFKQGLAEVVQATTGLDVASLASAAAIGVAIGALKTVGQELKKIVVDYSNYATQVEKFSRLTGISGEESSRLLQTADDFQVSVEQMGASLKWALQNGFVPTVENLAILADRYNSIKDPAERAAAMQKIFGRSWVEMTPLLEKGGDAIRANAKTIESGLIITDKAIEANKDYKRSIDTLTDSIESLKMIVGGQLVPIVTIGAKSLINYGEASKRAEKELGPLIGSNKTLVALYSIMLESAKAGIEARQTEAQQLRQMPDAYFAVRDALNQTTPAIDETTVSTSGLGKAMQEASQSGGKAMLDMKKMADDMQAGIVDATQGIMDAQKNWAEQTGGDVVNALEKAGLKGQDLRTAIGFVDDEYQSSYGTQFDYKEAVGDLATKYAEGKLSGDDFKQGLKDIKAEYMPLNDEIRTANELLWQLQLKWQWLQKNRNLDMSININQNGGLPNIGGGTYSSGGNITGMDELQKVQAEAGASVNVKPKKKGEAIGYATGGSYVIPAGYYENYPVGPGRYASSGETVTITEKGKSDAVQPINLSVTFTGSLTDRATAEKYARYTANYLKQRL